MSNYISIGEALQKLHDAGGCDATEEWAKGYDDGITEAIRIINEMPAADVAPVVHGQWIWVCEKTVAGFIFDQYKCSNCGILVFEHRSEDHSLCIAGARFTWDTRTPYCSQCGAKMDESEVSENDN